MYNDLEPILCDTIRIYYHLKTFLKSQIKFKSLSVPYGSKPALPPAVSKAKVAAKSADKAVVRAEKAEKVADKVSEKATRIKSKAETAKEKSTQASKKAQ